MDTSQDTKLVFESSEAVKIVSTFDQLGLKEDLLRGIYAYSESSRFFPPIYTSKTSNFDLPTSA